MFFPRVLEIHVQGGEHVVNLQGNRKSVGHTITTTQIDRWMIISLLAVTMANRTEHFMHSLGARCEEECDSKYCFRLKRHDHYHQFSQATIE